MARGETRVERRVCMWIKLVEREKENLAGISSPGLAADDGQRGGHGQE